MSEARRWFYLAVAAQGIFLIGWAGWNEAALRRSPTILLDTRPVDPSEILRGDYITMNYVIGSFSSDLLGPMEAPVEYGARVCVRVATAGEFWDVAQARTGACRCEGSLPPGEFELEGVAQPGFDGGVSVDYGIGRFYVPEGKGTPTGKLTARVAVTPWCRAMLKQVYLDGEPYP